jgi:hypothetical protein
LDDRTGGDGMLGVLTGVELIGLTISFMDDSGMLLSAVIPKKSVANVANP